MMGCVSLVRRPWFVLILFGLLIFATRVPLAPGQLFTFDDVNLAYAIGHFDIRMSQPHPPGYPLFVMEMRVLSWLHFRRAESILLALALLGSIAAILLLVYAGNRIFGRDSGFWAACILVLHPVFWHSGVTSALRVQLAVVSLSAGICCWNAWRGDVRWVTWSALAIGIGAGIRPETGPLLLPLWIACALRAPLTWKQRGKALGVMTIAVLIWLLPAMFASGGPLNFIRANLDYISDQASVSSGVFGATGSRWRTSVTQLLVWTFCGMLAWPLPAVLAWRRKGGWAVGWERLAFLGLWILPFLVFSILVHVEDPGHTLAMVPVVSLFGGYLINRALENSDAWVSRLQVPIMMLATYFMIQIYQRHDEIYLLTWLPVVCIATALAFKVAQTPNRKYFPRIFTIALILFPILQINYLYFNHHGWYFKGAPTTGIDASLDQAWADINSAFALTSIDQIHATLAVDDHTLRETRRLVAERPGKTIVIWERGLAAWRKAAYYSPGVQVVVLEHKKLRSGSPPVIAIWNGPKLERRLQGTAPLRLDLRPGDRIVWLLNPRTDFFPLVQQNFPLTQAGPVYSTDLPQESGSRLLGEYELVW